MCDNFDFCQMSNTFRKHCHRVSPGLNYANPLYGVATICHQVRWVRWGHPSPFHTATSLLIWYKMFCVRDISYRLIWMEFINMFSVYAQSGTHSRFNWWVIVVLTYNPSVLMCVEITDAPNSSGNVYKHGHLLWFQVSGRWGKISGVHVIHNWVLIQYYVTELSQHCFS